MDKIRSFFSGFRIKVAMALILSLFFMAILGNFLVYNFIKESQFRQLREKLMIIAQTAALAIDPDTLSSIPLNKEAVYSPAYKIISEKLMKIKNANPKIKYIYTLAQTEQPGIWQFIADPEPVSLKGNRRAATSFPGDRYNAGRFPEMLKAFSGPAADKKPEIDEWGKTLSGYAPVRDKAGGAIAVLGVDMDARDFYLMQKEALRRGMFILFLGVVFSLGLVAFVSSRVTSPIKKLVEGTRHIARGELGYQVQVRGRDEIGELARSFNQMAINLFQSRKQLEEYFYRVAQSLVRILEAKDHYTRGHSDRVAEFAVKIASDMGIAQEKIELLKRVAQLHDIGKLGVNETILNKIEPLSEEEWEMIRQHPMLGADILQPILLNTDMLAIVRAHHERYDGKGYPDRINGESINIFTRIISVADAYDAMTSLRAYRKAFNKEEAIAELKRNKGTQFSPEVVEVFVKLLREGEVG